MDREETIVNKIVTLETIIEIAKYLEDQKEEYLELFGKDEQKNNGLKYSEQVYEYKAGHIKVLYTIRYKDGREVSESNYNWFIGKLNDLSAVAEITFSSNISFSSNINNKENYQYKHINTWIHFKEEATSIKVDGTDMNEQVQRVYSYLVGLIGNGETRYSKTVKRRNMRIQSFCLSIGFVLSYILYLIIMANKAIIPAEYIMYLDNKWVLIIGQWVIAIILGNLFGLPIMTGLYKNIIPNAKYSHYDRNSKKSVYVDNVDEYVAGNEVQIGRFANNGKNRKTIEKIYKITSKIVLLQILINILMYVLIK